MSKYTIEQKKKAVKSALQASSITAAASELNIPISTLHDWVRDQRLLEQAGSAGDKNSIKKEFAKKDKEIRKLKEELEILKKFKAFAVKTRS